MFLDREQVQVIKGKLLAKETLQHNLSLAREKAEDEIAKRQGEPVKMYNSITFKDEEHTKLKKIKPFIKQIVSDMMHHADQFK